MYDRQYTRLLRETRAQPWTMEQLRQHVPSVFATRPAATMSDRYQYIPTAHSVQALIDQGFQVVRAGEARTRIAARHGYTSHMVVLRHRDQQPLADGLIPEVVLVNSHDGSAAWRLYAGVFRVVCSNGLIAVSGKLACVRVPHIGRDIVDAVIDGAQAVVRRLPDVLDQIRDWQSVRWEREQQLAYAAQALRLRWPSDAPITPAKAITPLRLSDNGTDAWITMNVVQEHLIKGRDFYWRHGSRMSTRRVKSVNTALHINARLWELTDRWVRGDTRDLNDDELIIDADAE